MHSRYSKFIVLLLGFFLFFCGLNYAYGASSLVIHTDKSVYEYGDHLSIVFEVSELKAEPITFEITDSSGKVSSPIPISITNLKTEITAPFAFYKTTFKSGTYHIDAKYDDTNSSAFFTIEDTGKIAIPSEYKNIVKLWSEGQQPTDESFVNIIRDLIQYDIIQIPESNKQSTNSVHMPNWFKNNAKWWSDDLISDNDFGLAIQYLIKTKIMTV